MTDEPSPILKPDTASPTRPGGAGPQALRGRGRVHLGRRDSSAALPPMKTVEIAFAGRSNVGKSSLVNALTGRKTLARTSHTPGRTQQLNFFDIGGRFTLVDMPGYGYAAVSKTKVDGVDRADPRLPARPRQPGARLPARRRPARPEADRHEVMDTLDKAAVSYQLVLTKADELKASDRGRAHRRDAGGTVAAARRPIPRSRSRSSRTGAGHPRAARRRRPACSPSAAPERHGGARLMAVLGGPLRRGRRRAWPPPPPISAGPRRPPPRRFAAVPRAGAARSLPLVLKAGIVRPAHGRSPPAS